MENRNKGKGKYQKHGAKPKARYIKVPSPFEKSQLIKDPNNPRREVGVFSKMTDP